MSRDEPKLTWDAGTAYDLFISLLVLHDPARYGLRGAWAAGVRSRLPAAERAFLKKAVDAFVPFSWLHSLPQPKNGATVLDALAAIPAGERLATITFDPPTFPADLAALLKRVSARGVWDDKDLHTLKGLVNKEKDHFKRTKRQLEHLLDLWVHPEQTGEMYLKALRTYYDSFFAEEEARIIPYLEAAVAAGQEMAGQMSLIPLLEELSQGLRFTALPALAKIVLVPSFWSTPLIVETRLADDQEMFVFGARPSGVSLVPGEPVPDDLARALKALADPTRLRILHYLAQEPLTPTRLAERLRLRPPTVIHHLHVLRLARLVRLTMEAEGKRRYAVRAGGVAQTCTELKRFIEVGGAEG